MCGLFGYSFPANSRGRLTKEQRTAILLALATGNEERGDDSWGFYAPDPITPIYQRGTGGITKRKGGLLDLIPHTFIMFHTRRSTVGKSTEDNAHPFEIGDVVGAQNGGVTNHDKMDKKYKRNCAVDSMHVFHHLNENLPFDELEGYGAIEFTRKSNPNLITIVNVQGGSMNIWCLGGKHDEYGVIWSSDEKHLAKAMNWAGISKFTSYKVEEGAPYLVVRNRPGLSYDPNTKLKFGTYSRTYSTSKWSSEYDRNKWDPSTSYRSHTDFSHTRTQPIIGPSSVYDNDLEIIRKPIIFGLDSIPEKEKLSLKGRLLEVVLSASASDRTKAEQEISKLYASILSDNKTVVT